MRLTDTMIVPESIRDDEADIRYCPECKAKNFHGPQKVMVFSPGGMRMMRLWACDSHPLPPQITDNPNENKENES